METIKPCNPYAARPAGTALYTSGATALKVYYVDIYGRPNRERFEWDLCGRPRESVLESLARVRAEGVGAVAAFPHITKIFRFAPSAETIMHVRAYWTPDFSPVDRSLAAAQAGESGAAPRPRCRGPHRRGRQACPEP